jgi:serine/threonine protein kinase
MARPAAYRNALPLQSALQEYRLEQVLGAGGFGITYLAQDTHLEKRVAIKEYLPGELAMRTPEGSVLPVTTEREPDYRWGLDRFLQEARTLAKFSHPHIVRVNRYFEANGTAYMVMDYEEGQPLRQWLQHAPLPEEAALKRLLGPLLEGLAAVHAAGFLHRDIKPDNIFVRASGQPVLIDFGAARQALGGTTRSLTSVLTPGFAPLEQYASDGRQGPWTDLYAMGGVLYRAVTDRNPPDAVTRLRGDSVGAGLGAARGRYSESFLRAVEWALALDEKRRPQNVEEWRPALLGERAAPAAAAPTLRAATALAAPPSASPAEPKTLREEKPAPAPPAAPRRRRWVIVALAGIAAAIAIGALLRKQRPAPVERVPVEATAPKAPVAAEEPAQKLKRLVEAEFRAADANGDGFLSQDEVRGRFPGLAREFQRADADGDGRISPREFFKARRLQLERRLAK